MIFKVNHKLFTFLWLLCIAYAVGYCYHVFSHNPKINSNILDLLADGNNERLKLARQLLDNSNLANNIVIMIGHKEQKIIELAVADFRTQVTKLKLSIVEKPTATIAAEYKRFFTDGYQYRAGLLAKEDRQQLLANKADNLLNRALQEIMSPFNTLGSPKLITDPYFLYPTFIQALNLFPTVKVNCQGELLVQDADKTWALLNMTVTNLNFSLEQQQKFSTQISKVFAKLSQKHGVELLKTGSIFYTIAGTKQAQQEIMGITIISLLAIIVIICYFFHSYRPLLLAIAVILPSFIIAIVVCQLIFHTIHIVALIFACSLVGVAIDYVFYYYCATYSSNTNSSRFTILLKLMPALPLGVISACLGYGLLLLIPFPGVRQMAVFTIVGLVTAFINVCLFAPYLVPSNNNMPKQLSNIAKLLQKFRKFKVNKILIILSYLGILSVFLLGIARLKVEDNVHTFQALSAELQQEEQKISTLLKFNKETKFLLVKEKSIEALLQREEAVMEILDKLQEQKQLTNYRAFAMLFPSQQRQRENRELIMTQLYGQRLIKLAKTINVNLKADVDLLGVNNMLMIPGKTVPTGWQDLIHYEPNGEVLGYVLLTGVVNSNVLQKALYKFTKVYYIDPPMEYSELFSKYRLLITYLLFAVLTTFFTLLSIKVGIIKAFKIIKPLGLSLLASIGVLGLSYKYFTLFHAMGLILVAGVGIDYALFLYYQKTTNNQDNVVLLIANTFAALTTVLSFGLLLFSNTTAIANFGFMVFLGIVFCYLFTTIFLGADEYASK